MKILIIGGTGVISTELVKTCIDSNLKVYCVNRGKNKQFEHPSVEYIYADVRKKDALKNAIKNNQFDVVLDFLSYTKAELTQTVTQVAESCKNFIFVSSIAVFTPIQSEEIISENTDKNNPWLYGKNKLECEQFLIEFCNDKNLNYTIIRPAITYANTRIPFCFLEKTNHYSLIKRILASKPIIMPSTGEHKITFTHSSDFAKVLIRLFNNPKAYNQDFNIACGQVLSWNEVVNVLEDILDEKISVVNVDVDTVEKEFIEFKDELKYNKCTNIVVDQTKLFDAIGEFECELNFKDGLQKTLKFYKSYEKLKNNSTLWDEKCDYIIIKQLGKVAASQMYPNFERVYSEYKLYKLKKTIQKISYPARVLYGKVICVLKNER